jgi:hypothetical protein
MESIAHPLMEPWIGTKYFSSPFNGIKLLILGESEYEWDSGCLTRDIATKLISEIADGKWTHKFYSNIFKVLTGISRHAAVPGTYRDFWHSVSFYNFVQDAVGPRPRCRPTPAMWNNGLAYFETVFSELSPECVLVLGKALWQHVSGTGIIEVSNECRHVLSIQGVVAATTFICHPSSSRYSYSAWRPAVEKLLLEAKEQKKTESLKQMIT